MEDELIFSKEWFMLEKYHFKILAVITELANNTGTFKGEYHLIFKEGISANTLHRMKKGESITTKTLDTLCFILDCEVSDILYHDKSQ